MKNTNHLKWYHVLIFLHACFISSAQGAPVKVNFNAADGLVVTADHYQVNDPSAPTIILFHQSVSSRGEYAPIAPRLQKAGFNALAVDLRWGRRDYWNKTLNETAFRYGIEPILAAIEKEDKKELIWPTIFEAYQDMEAALRWVNETAPNNSILIWGSSFSAMLQFKLASEHPEDIDGMIAFSPGEYYPQDSTLLSQWASKIKMPVYISCGKSEDERLSGKALLDVIPTKPKQLYQSKKGRHGSSILFSDEDNWSDLFPFLWRFVKPDKYIEKAILTANWLEEHELKIDSSISWPDEVGSDKVSFSLSSGMSGKIMFLLGLWTATSDSTYLKKAQLAANYLLMRLPEPAGEELDKGGAYSLFGNICGPGTALMALWEETQEKKYRKGFEKILSIIKTKVNYSEQGAYWDTHNDVLTGLAGTSLFLLDVYNRLEDSSLLELAEKAGEELMSRAIKDKNGLNWYWAQDRQFVLPNFSHGTAGIGYTLACLYESGGQKAFLEAAEKASDYLLSISHPGDDVLLIPYGIPNEGWDRPYDVGWAHGAAGSAQLFGKLYELTKDQKYLNLLKKSAEGIIQSGWPGEIDSLFGAIPLPIDLRFGLAGIASFLLDGTQITGDKSYAVLARQMTDEILSQAKSTKEGIYWSIPAYGFMGKKGSPKVFTGLFYGSAGYGLLFLKLDRYLREDYDNK